MNNKKLKNSIKLKKTDNNSIKTCNIRNKYIVSDNIAVNEINLHNKILKLNGKTEPNKILQTNDDGMLVWGNSLYDGLWSENDSNTLYYKIGNVGVGTSTPSESLEVSGNTKIRGKLDFLSNDDLSNISIGNNVLENINGGTKNIGLGINSLISNTTGYENIGIGYNVLKTNQIGSSNIGLGINTLLSNTSGDNNIALGESSLHNNIIGNGNTSLGSNSLYLNTNGDNNTAIGESSLYNIKGSNNVGIGYKAGWGKDVNNKLFIQNDDDNLLIYGDFKNKQVAINQDTLTNGYNLEVSGNTKIKGNLNVSSIDISNSMLKLSGCLGKSNQIIKMNNVGNSLEWVDTTEYSNIWSKNNKKIYYNIDNVGIGTINPDSQLHIHNTNKSVENVAEIHLTTGYTGIHKNNDGLKIISAGDGARFEWRENSAIKWYYGGGYNLNMTTDGDLEFQNIGKSVILKSPNNTKYRITVDNSGVIGTEKV
tara:strand:- start:627 stop:2066 length:1440 start_codon:yes stop_codon:yes gene_type:complete